MDSKSINTEEDIKGLLYIVEYVDKEYFPSVTKLGGNSYRDICTFMENFGRNISESTVRRIFNFKKKPSPITYDKLDDLSYWCFNRNYENFQEFLDDKRQEIELVDLISSEEVENILEILRSKSKSVVVNQDKTLILDNQRIEINDSEGYLKKFFNALSESVGDFTEQAIEKNKTQRREKIDPANGRIAERILRKEKHRQKNIEQIVSKAIDFVRIKESTENEVDPDWISEFFDISQNTSNEKMQYLWAKILASEVDRPGSFSRRTINAIKLMDAQEATIFSLLCNCLWELYPGETRSDMVLITNMNSNGYYSDATWGFDGMLLRHLEDLGLIHETFINFEEGEEYSLSYFGNDHIIRSTDGDVELDMTRLSTVGSEIYDVVMAKSNEEYYKYTIDYLAKKKILKK